MRITPWRGRRRLHVGPRFALGLGPRGRASGPPTPRPSDDRRRRVPHPGPRLGACPCRPLAHARARQHERRTVGPERERPRADAAWTPRPRLHEPPGTRLRGVVVAARVVAPRVIEWVTVPGIAAVPAAETEAPAVTAVAAPTPRTTAPAARKVRIVQRIAVP